MVMAPHSAKPPAPREKLKEPYKLTACSTQGWFGSFVHGYLRLCPTYAVIRQTGWVADSTLLNLIIPPRQKCKKNSFDLANKKLVLTDSVAINSHADLHEIHGLYD